MGVLARLNPVARLKGLSPASRTRLLYGGVFGAVAALAFAKAVRVPNPYSTSHWLFSYHHGFIRRALVGTLLSPVAREAAPRTTFALILALSLGFMLAFFVGVGVVGFRIARRRKWSPAVFPIPILFAASPAAVLTVHCIGYLDTIVFLLGLGAIALVVRRHFALAGLTCALATLVHEVFLAVILPAVLLATVAQSARESGLSAGRRAVYALRRLILVAAPVGALTLWMFFGPKSSPDDLLALETEVVALEIVKLEESPTMFHALENSFSSNLEAMAKSWRKRKLKAPLFDLGMHLPFVALVLLSLGVELRRSAVRRRIVALVLGGAILGIFAPLLVHLVAWDDNRINGYVGIAAFFVWAGLLSGPWPEAASPPSFRGFAAVSGLVLLCLLSSEPALFDGHRVGWYPHMFLRLEREARKLRPALSYRDLAGGALLFPNSDFEEGTLDNWTPEGIGFDAQPVKGDPGVARGRPAVPEGQFWLGLGEGGSLEKRALGRARRGPRKLISVPFVVSDDVIIFKLGGTCKRGDAYVALRVGEEELARYCGEDDRHRMDLVRVDVSAQRGKTMVIEIVEESGRGRLHADGFRYQAH